MARSPRIFQTIIQGTKTGEMKGSFASESTALADIASGIAFSKTEPGQTHWGDIVKAVLLNKATGETTTII